MIDEFNSKEKVYQYLQMHHVAALSTVSENGEPHGALVFIFADPDLNFYFFTKSGTKKAANLTKNAKAAITVFDPSVPRTIQSKGSVQVVKDKVLYDQIFNQLLEEAAHGEDELYWPPPFSKIYTRGELLLYKYTPEWLRFADFSESKTFFHVNLENNFFQIIPPEKTTKNNIFL